MSGVILIEVIHVIDYPEETLGYRYVQFMRGWTVKLYCTGPPQGIGPLPPPDDFLARIAHLGDKLRAAKVGDQFWIAMGGEQTKKMAAKLEQVKDDPKKTLTVASIDYSGPVLEVGGNMYKHIHFDNGEAITVQYRNTVIHHPVYGTPDDLFQASKLAGDMLRLAGVGTRFQYSPSKRPTAHIRHVTEGGFSNHPKQRAQAFRVVFISGHPDGEMRRVWVDRDKMKKPFVIREWAEDYDEDDDQWEKLLQEQDLWDVNAGDTLFLNDDY